jgi:hypothetical protein
MISMLHFCPNPFSLALPLFPFPLYTLWHITLILKVIFLFFVEDFASHRYLEFTCNNVMTNLESDFGGFQFPKVREKRVLKITQFLYF